MQHINMPDEITRRIRWGALATALAVLPLFGAAGAVTAPRTLSSLTSTDLANLRPDSPVKLPSGKVFTMGQLRTEHDAIAARFANARSLVSKIAFGERHALFPAPLRTTPLTSATTAPASAALTLVPWQTSNQYAGDYTAFCAAAHGSICLYLPLDSSGIGVFQGTTYSVTDALIPPNVCSQEGGQSSPDGCQYVYPTTVTMTFFPGVPATAMGTVAPAACPGFTLSYDAHGSATVAYAPSSRYQAILECVEQIFAPPQAP